MLFTSFTCVNKVTGEELHWSCSDTTLVHRTINDYCQAVCQFALLSGLDEMRDISRLLLEASACKDLDDINRFADKHSMETEVQLMYKLKSRSHGYDLSVVDYLKVYLISKFWHLIFFNMKINAPSTHNFVGMLKEFENHNAFEHNGIIAVENLLVGHLLQMTKVKVGLAGGLSICYDSFPVQPSSKSQIEWTSKTDDRQYTFEDLLEDGLVTMGIPMTSSFYNLLSIVSCGLIMVDKFCKVSAGNIDELRCSDRFKLFCEAFRTVLKGANEYFPTAVNSVVSLKDEELIDWVSPLLLLDDLLF